MGGPPAAGPKLAAKSRQGALGLAGLAGLALTAVPLAAPGRALVPAASGSAPGWLLGFFGEGLGIGAGLYYFLLWLAFASYLCVLIAAPALDRRLLWWLSCALVLGFALAPPLLSQDVFSYIDYGRLGALHGLDPYLHAPAAAPSDPAFSYVGWADSASAYGPLFTLASYPLAWLPLAVALWTFKAMAAASVLALAAVVARIAPGRGIDPRRGLAMVALNPLVLVHVVGGAHNDAMAVALAIGGCGALLARREASGGAALVSALALKISSAFVIPFALLGTRHSPGGRKVVYGLTDRPIDLGMRRFAIGAALAAAILGLLSLLAFGWHWLDAFALVGENQGRVSNYSIPNLLSELLNLDIELLRGLALGAYLALIGALLAWVWRGGDWIQASGWAGLGLLLTSAWLLPWYLIWVLPFAALSRDRRLIAAVLALTALQLAARLPL